MNSHLLAAAVTGLLLGAASPAHANTMATDVFEGASAQGLDTTDPAKHACKGQNACKGQGGCKTDKHACKGQNGCKGQGGCRTDGGPTPKDDKGGKHSCSGKNGCGK